MSLLERVQRRTTGEEEAPSPGRPKPAPRTTAPVKDEGAAPAARRGIAERRGSVERETHSGPVNPHFSSIKSKVHARLVEDLRETDESDRDAIIAKITDLVATVLAESHTPMAKPERTKLIEAITNDVLGLGPLEELLSDPDISEIMVNGPRQIYIERAGKLYQTDVTFESSSQLQRVIERIVGSVGRRIDESSPMVDARLKDGSRVNVIIPPLALTGPTITIRKFSVERFDLTDLVRIGSLTEEMGFFLEACVRARLNILVSGGTGSGKTTTLNVLSGFIPDDERIVTIEDAAEIQLHQDHVVTLESRPSNVEGRGRITIRDLVINALRMRPDRIVVGECRGGEALDMLQAMNTGHDGSLTTIHANSPEDAINRLETLVLMAGAELPSRAIRDQIGSAIHVIVQQARMRDGSRRIIDISEVIGIEGERVKTQEIFRYKQTGIDEDGKVHGYFTATGVLPACIETLTEAGEELPISLFQVAGAA